MVAKVANLRQARKTRDRAAKRKAADENAVRHGLAKPERLRRETAAQRDDKHLDGHKVEE